jgi:hypothetical protein
MTTTPCVPLAARQHLLKRQVGLLAKSDGTPLWIHSFAVWAITARLAARIPRFDGRDRLHLELAALLHDDAKRLPHNQAILRGEKTGAVIHPLTQAHIREAMTGCPELDLTSADLDRIWEFAHHHSLPETEQKRLATPAVGLYCSVLRWADWLASMAGRDELEPGLVERLRLATQDILDWTVFTVGRPPSPTTTFLLRLAHDRYRALGWEPVTITEQAILFVGAPGSRLPSKAELVGEVAASLRRQSIAGQNIQFKYIRYEVFAGEAKEDPAGFLAARQDFFLNHLGDVERGPILFFRSLMDLLKIRGDLGKVRKHLPVIDILAQLGGTNSVTKGKAAWSSLSGDPPDLEINAILRRIFESRSLNDLLRGAPVTPLRSLRPDELFAVLTGLAGGTGTAPTADGMNRVLSAVVGMEEEADFAGLAAEALARYSAYKESHRPRDGLCEQCATPVPLEAKPTLNIPQGRTGGFTQVNVSSDAPKAICPLCVFDAAAARKDVSGQQAVIYARITSPLPEIWSLFPDLDRWVRRLDQALQNIQEIRKLEECPELAHLPLPPRFPFPTIGERIRLPEMASQESPRGLLIPLDTIRKGEGLKELRARYMALHSLLQAMGLTAHIGREEQVGLFGERPDQGSAPNWNDRYRLGLSVNILAHGLKKSKKKTSSVATFARNLLESSPGVALSFLVDAEEKQERRGPLLKDSLLAALVENLVAARLVIAVGKETRFTMEDLLQHARFFATHRHFFGILTPRERTRHAVCKPVDAVMNALLQGQDFEEAFSRMMALVRENVPNEVNPGSKAKFDQNDLVVFLKEAKAILARYARLRHENIAAFIRTKNALRAALYMVSRYPKLKEVITHD